MSFRVPGEGEFTGNSSFGVLKEDSYRAQILSYENKEGASVTNEYNPNGELRVWFTLAPIAIDGDDEAEMLNTEDEPISDEKTLLFFFDPKRLGLFPVVAKSRAFFSAAMGIPVEQPVEFDSLKALCDALVGKELVIDVGINAKKKNVIKGTRPVRKRVPKRVRAEKPSLVESAAEVFAGEVEDL
jgi:hypothetical protein